LQLCIDSEGDYFEQTEWSFESNSRLVYLMDTVLTEQNELSLCLTNITTATYY
jgi:hypothetical protein